MTKASRQRPTDHPNGVSAPASPPRRVPWWRSHQQRSAGAAPADCVAELSGASYRYPPSPGRPELPVLSEVSLQVQPGEYVAVIGPSGCGKTTVLRLLAGLASRAGLVGEVLVNGRPVRGASPEIGYVFQHVGLIPWRTVRRNVEFALEVRNHRRPNPEERARVAEMIDLVGLAGFESYHPGQLSGGMQQRVGVARALVTLPELLLLDEPFGALDAQTRRLFHDEMLRWRKSRDFATVMVTHDLDEAIYLADRIIVMSARPARVLADIAVQIPGRHEAELRSLDGYSELYTGLWDLLVAENTRDEQVP